MTESSSYEERHARAATSFACSRPGVEPERVAASSARRQGALGGFGFDVVGEMWAGPSYPAQPVADRGVGALRPGP